MTLPFLNNDDDVEDQVDFKGVKYKTHVYPIGDKLRSLPIHNATKSIFQASLFCGKYFMVTNFLYFHLSSDHKTTPKLLQCGSFL